MNTTTAPAAPAAAAALAFLLSLASAHAQDAPNAYSPSRFAGSGIPKATITSAKYTGRIGEKVAQFDVALREKRFHDAIRERIGYLGVACGERSDRRNAQSTGQRTRPHAVGQETQGLGNCMHLSGAAACPILVAMRPGSWVLRPPVTTGRPNVTFR